MTSAPLSDSDRPAAIPASHLATPAGLKRARALAVPFKGTAGHNNAITDVPGVLVGYETLISGDGPLQVGQGPVRTGVTAVLPRGRDGIGHPCAAGYYSLNGNGEMTGIAWLEENGSIDLPIVISNTHAIGPCHRGTIDWLVQHRPDLAAEWLLPVVAETWDGYLNDINGPHVQSHHVLAAIDRASGGPIEEGSVGGGTGMNCYAFKGGNGTASRRITHGPDSYTVGAFVQANFGARHELSIAGIRLGEMLGDDNPIEDYFTPGPAGAGSVIVILATDAPLLPGQCKALARRVPLGLARTGTAGSHFSGDLFLAFSTANKGAFARGFPKAEPTAETYEQLRFIPWAFIDPLYEAAVQAVEEAVVNALIANRTMIGRDNHRSPALPHDRLLAALAARG